ncbi:MAG: M15 family metallopeptidase [Oscillospiraceae bacterium]|nr:M15 family metallopeptidase [Oscillospiraceae bacterium]
MKKRIICVLLLLTLLTPAVTAQGAFADLPEEHWAYADMSRAVELGILNGVGGGLMDPQGTLTWAQCLTMLSRAFAPAEYRRATQEDGLLWYEAGWRIARERGLVQEEDFLPVTEETLNGPISRQDTAVLLKRVLPADAADRYSRRWYDESVKTAEEMLVDFYTMDQEHRGAVSDLFDIGIIKGRDDGAFGPNDTLRRADGTVLVIRTLRIVDYDRFGQEVTLTLTLKDRETGETVKTAEAESYIGCSLYEAAEENAPEGYEPVSGMEYGSVSSAQNAYTLTLEKLTRTELDEKSAWALYRKGDMTYEDYLMQDFWLRRLGSNARKSMLLFGNREQIRYDSREEAETHMTTIEVPVWHLSGTNKTPGRASLAVHEAVADDVIAIFNEIDNDPERFPICDIGGYSWRGDSAKGEHNCGTAIDLNADQNCQVRGGQVVAGSYWKPGEDPYSIPEDGSVVRIFAEHGWSWGGNAWPSTQDYMHFSYMGR